MRYSFIRSLLLLATGSLLAGACAPASSIDTAYGATHNGGMAYTRTIFSTHNF
jgi:hypothetical protein